MLTLGGNANLGKYRFRFNDMEMGDDIKSIDSRKKSADEASGVRR